MCLVLYFVALALWLHGRGRTALAMAVWAVLIKEEAAIVVGMFGLHGALTRKPRWPGLVLAAVMFGYFGLITRVVLPAMVDQYMVVDYFAPLGDSFWEISLSPLARPRAFWGKLCEPATVWFAASLLAPLLFLPLRRPRILFVGGATFLFVSLFTVTEAKTIGRQYQYAHGRGRTTITGGDGPR